MVSAPPFTHDDLRRFVPEARRIIAFGRILAWRVRWSNSDKKLVVLHAPNGGKELHIPTTNINYKRARSWMKQMLTYSEPMDVMNLLEGGFDLRKEPDIAQLVATYGTELSEQLKEWQKEDEQKVAIEAVSVVGEGTMANALRDAQAEKAGKAEKKQRQSRAAPPEPDKPEPEESHGVTERRVVSERPWLAKRGGTKGASGRVYESQGVMVVTYDDGTEAYKCRFCDFTHPDNPRSVKMHAANRKSFDPTHQAVSERVLLRTDDYEPSDIKKPHRAAVARLTNDLVAALDGLEAWQALEAHELASVLAQRVVDARPEHHVSTEPLTAAQVLARITSLVDNGQIASLHRQVGEMRDALAEQTARADRLYDERKALRDMLAEES